MLLSTRQIRNLATFTHRSTNTDKHDVFDLVRKLISTKDNTTSIEDLSIGLKKVGLGFELNFIDRTQNARRPSL